MKRRFVGKGDKIFEHVDFEIKAGEEFQEGRERMELEHKRGQNK